ncbi:MAG: glycosyltransferase family 117 protein, partial [Rubrobacter sp.]
MALEQGHDEAIFSPKGSARAGKGRFGAALAGAGICLLPFVLYVGTLAPTVLPYSSPDLLDAAMLQMQVAVLGISHPTGYPTYLMLSHLFTYLPVGDVAYRTNLASAFWATLASLAVYAAGLLLSRSVVAAAVGALTFGRGTALWSQAVIAEVYPLNALFVALTVLALLYWREHRRDRYLLLSALLTGLCLTNHLTSGLILPAALLFVGLVERHKLLNWRLMLKAAGLFFLGLAPYLYLPMRAWMDAPFVGNNPANVERFWYIVSGGNLTGTFFAFGPAEFPGRLAFYWGHLLENMNPLVVMVALTGAATMFFRDRAGAGLFGFLFFGWLIYALGNDIPDIHLYFIPTYLVLCLWATLGFGTLLELAGSMAAGSSRVP